MQLVGGSFGSIIILLFPMKVAGGNAHTVVGGGNPCTQFLGEYIQ